MQVCLYPEGKMGKFACGTSRCIMFIISSPEPKARKVNLQCSLRVFFLFPTHNSGADCFTPCNPTQGSNQTLPVIL